MRFIPLTLILLASATAAAADAAFTIPAGAVCTGKIITGAIVETGDKATPREMALELNSVETNFGTRAMSPLPAPIRVVCSATASISTGRIHLVPKTISYLANDGKTVVESVANGFAIDSNDTMADIKGNVNTAIGMALAITTQAQAGLITAESAKTQIDKLQPTVAVEKDTKVCFAFTDQITLRL